MQNRRLYLLIFFVILVGLVLISRLFFLQVIRYEFYRGGAAGQHQTYQTLLPKRGGIFIKDRFYGKDASSQLFPLAVNREWPMVYAVPKDIENKQETIKVLASLLEINEEVLAQKINKRNDPYEPVKHKLSDEVANRIEELNIKGIKIAPEGWRYYPNGTLASHVVGFVGVSEAEKVGQYGIEEYYNQDLEGRHGYVEGEKDARGRLIANALKYLEPAQDGADLILTIDPNIQFFIEARLKEVVEKLEAESGTIIVENPKTGAIKALANWPAFNPNEYSKVEDVGVFLNPAIHKLFEPGSIFKPVTMAIALEKKLITSNTTYEDKGIVKIGGYSIENSDNKSNGIQTMTQVLEKSLNTGAVFVQQLIGKKGFKDYLERFGFSRKTKVDLAGEIKGNISNLDNKRDIEYATASFGQGIAITPMQLLAALGSIANKGKMMRPYLVEKFVYKDGREEVVKPELAGRVVSLETAEELTKMMINAVENGYSRKARVPGYFIAGKTGTAQVPSSDKKGYSNRTIHSFGGFFPAFDPEFMVLIKLDNPCCIRFAADSITPVFNEIVKYIINYYEIPPSR